MPCSSGRPSRPRCCARSCAGFATPTAAGSSSPPRSRSAGSHRALVELAEHHGEPDGDGIAITLPITQEELAGWTGSSREAVAKSLASLRGLGAIRTERRRIVVLDLEVAAAPGSLSGETGPMVCRSCQTENNEGARFCRACGASLALACPSCGAPHDPDQAFCDQCGTRLEAGASAAPPAVSAPELRVASVLFVDLVGYTPLSETRDVEEVRDLLSGYFDLARTIVDRYGGTVEKFIGDAVMAVWGVPVARGDDAERSVRAGLELVDAVARFGETVGVATLAGPRRARHRPGRRARQPGRGSRDRRPRQHRLPGPGSGRARHRVRRRRHPPRDRGGDRVRGRRRA